MLMPELLQSLDQYDATSAGIVLTPRAIVIVVMAPLVVRLMPIVGANLSYLSSWGALLWS